MPGTKLLTAVAVTIGSVLLPSSAAFGLTTTSGSDYGHHVVSCAQTHGFDGTHNPGMHQGFAGWDGGSC